MHSFTQNAGMNQTWSPFPPLSSGDAIRATSCARVLKTYYVAWVRGPYSLCTFPTASLFSYWPSLRPQVGSFYCTSRKIQKCQFHECEDFVHCLISTIKHFGDTQQALLLSSPLACRVSACSFSSCVSPSASPPTTGLS